MRYFALVFDCVIIGGGLAGACVAHALATRNKRVIVLEREKQLAAHASHNASAILSPYLTNAHSQMAKVYAQGFAYSVDLLEKIALQKRSDFCQPHGAIQFPSTPRIQKIFEAREEGELSEKELEQIIGARAVPPAFHIPRTRVVDMPKLVAALFDHRNIEVKVSGEAQSIESSPDGWCVKELSGSVLEKIPNAVVCSGYEAKRFSQLSHIPLEPVRGEIWKLGKEHLNIEPKKVFLFGGYLTPFSEGTCTLGGSFRHADFSLETNHDELQKLVKQAASFMPELFRERTLSGLHSWVGFRTSTHDRLPYIGQVPDFDRMQSEAARYRSGSDLKKLVPRTFIPGLWTSIGHGSRGLTTCPVAGEVIARLVCGEALGELEDLAKKVCVSRLTTLKISPTSQRQGCP